MIDSSQDHFALFGLPQRFSCDPASLDAAYRALQTEIHPDRHVATDAATQRVAVQTSALVNEAYRTLKDPVARAEYLLALHGVDTGQHTDSALPIAFLERQLERREAAEAALAAFDAATLEAMLSEVRAEARAIERDIAVLIDGDRNWTQARMPARELRFLVKLGADIDAMIERIEA